jgi:hypothetical protein
LFGYGALPDGSTYVRGSGLVIEPDGFSRPALAEDAIAATSQYDTWRSRVAQEQAATPQPDDERNGANADGQYSDYPQDLDTMRRT